MGDGLGVSNLLLELPDPLQELGEAAQSQGSAAHLSQVSHLEILEAK